MGEFVGFVNFYHRFIRNCSSLIQPLTDLLGGSNVPKNRPLVLSDSAVHAFRTAKAALADASLLFHPVPNAPLQLMVDGSDVGVGGVLQQLIESTWKPLSFFLKRLRPAETKYSTFGRELLATYLSVKHFRHLLEGRPFAILTHHRALVSAIGSQSNNYSAHEIRHLAFVAEFTTDIQHVAGTDNVVADAFSRGSINDVAQSSPVDFTALATDQETDVELQQLRSSSTTALQLQLITVPGSPVSLWCDVSTGTSRPYMTPAFGQSVFESVHHLAHPGARATHKLIANRFVWSGMGKDITALVRNCVQCQGVKIQRHTRSPVGSFVPTSGRFERVHIDLIGPLPTSRGWGGGVLLSPHLH